MSRLLHRIKAFLLKRELDSDLDLELATHIDLATEENLSRGMSPEEARRNALVRFGGADLARELHRDARGLPQLDSIVQDVRYGLRSLKRSAGFTTVSLLILALGIGANTAVFSVVNTVMLRPLPFRDANQLVWLVNDMKLPGGTSARPDLSTRTFPVDVFEAMRSLNQTFDDITAYNAFFSQGDYKLLGRGEPERLAGVPVAENFFSVLGVEPLLGRLFLQEESQKNGRKAVLLSHAFWQKRFGADPAVVGQSLTLNQDAVVVVGVLPATFDFGSVFSPGTRIDIYVPAVMDDMRNDGNELALIGRLKPGVSIETARAEFNTLAPAFRRAHPDWYALITAKLSGLKDHVSGHLSRALVTLWCAVSLILLIVCVNLANLLLARSASRSKEFALRIALGAGRLRIVRQLFTESLLLAAGGSILGLILAFMLTGYLATSGTIAVPLLRSVNVDGAALAFTMQAAAGAALLFGLAPGIKVAGGYVQDSLKESARGSSEPKSHRAFRSTLVVCQVALACVLLVGAGLLLRSFREVLDVDMGFQPGHAIAMRVDYGSAAPQAKLNVFFGEVLRQVSAIPGIDAVGITDALPMSQNRSWGVMPPGGSWPRDARVALVNIVSPGFLEAMGMTLRAGTGFTRHDTETSQPVIMVNEILARQIWPGKDPIGQSAFMDSTHSRRVVGVVANVRETSPEEQSGAAFFLPITQTRDLAGSSDQSSGKAHLIIRTKLPLDAIAPGVRAVLRALNPNQPVRDFQLLEELVEQVTSPRRFFALLVTAFALLGLLLASLGIYGVISYSVARRTQEIGIRMALGASAREVQMSVIQQTFRMALIGIGVGTLASLAAAKLVSSLLFNIRPTDPVTFIGMVMVLGLVALIAGYVPARRASQVDPVTALRAE